MAVARIVGGSAPHLEFTSLRKMLLRVLTLALVFSRCFLKECPVEGNSEIHGMRVVGQFVAIPGDAKFFFSITVPQVEAA